VVLFLDNSGCACLESLEFLNFGITTSQKNILACAANQDVSLLMTTLVLLVLGVP
jgi:hypothetical protein